MTNTNTATVLKVGRHYLVTFSRNGAEIGIMVYTTRASMLRNFRAYGVVS